MAKKAAPRFTLPGTARQAMPGARAAAPVEPDQRIEVSLRLRAKTPVAHALDASGARPTTPPASAATSRREQFAASHGADAADLAKVAAFAKAHGLASSSRRGAPQRRAFRHHAGHERRVRRQRCSSSSTPAAPTAAAPARSACRATWPASSKACSASTTAPPPTPHFQRYEPVLGMRSVAARLVHAAAARQAVRLPDRRRRQRPVHRHHRARRRLQAGRPQRLLRRAGHRRPHGQGGAGRRREEPPDQRQQRRRRGDARHRGRRRDRAEGDDRRVLRAQHHDQGFLDAITTAVHDSVNKPSVISISWGSAESNWTTQAMTQYDQAFQAAAAMGVTICVRRGRQRLVRRRRRRQGARRLPGLQPQRARPAAAPSCWPAAPPRSRRRSVWNEGATTSATGGGVSGFFALPAYQAKAGVPVSAGAGGKAGRGVPDVAGDADPATGYECASTARPS